jgi:hypothetical protein
VPVSGLAHADVVVDIDQFAVEAVGEDAGDEQRQVPEPLQGEVALLGVFGVERFGIDRCEWATSWLRVAAASASLKYARMLVVVIRLESMVVMAASGVDYAQSLFDLSAHCSGFLECALRTM